MAKLNRWHLGICVGLVFFGAAQARLLSSNVAELDEIPRLRPEFKVPDDPDMLFYIERSSNSNTVVYAANRNAQGNFIPARRSRPFGAGSMPTARKKR